MFEDGAVAYLLLSDSPTPYKLPSEISMLLPEQTLVDCLQFLAQINLFTRAVRPLLFSSPLLLWPLGVQSWALRRGLCCANLRLVARDSHEAGFTQLRAHLIPHRCAIPFGPKATPPPGP